MAATWTLGIFIGLVPLIGWHMDPDGFETCSYRRVIDIGYNVYSKLFGFQFPIVLVMLYLNAGVYYAFRGAKTQRSVIVFRTVFYYAFRRAKMQRTVSVFRTVLYYAFRGAKMQRTVTVFRTVFYYAFRGAKTQRSVIVFRTVL